MFIHVVRAAVLRVKREGSSLGKWMSGWETRTARNVVIVATANKLDRSRERDEDVGPAGFTEDFSAFFNGRIVTALHSYIQA